MSVPIRTSEFDAIIPYITAMDASDNMITLSVPESFRLDGELVCMFFDDPVLSYSNPYCQPVFTGRMKDTQLFDYLLTKAFLP